MKKKLLLGIVLISGFGLTAQNRTGSGAHFQKIKPALKNQSAFYNPYKSVIDPVGSFEDVVQNINSQQQNRAVSNTNIGSTYYDLQTNRAVANRAILNSDGTISACWTYANTSPAPPGGTPERGTGYVYYDGSTWSPAPTARLENVRVGWPNLGVTSSGKEIIISHLASGSTHDLIMMTRPVKGTGSWTQTALGIPDTWSRMTIGGSNGETIHLISQTQGAAPTNPPYGGQDAAISYSRSPDGGVTWDKIRTVIPQIDSSNYLTFGGDHYNITSKGDTVAIVIGGFLTDVILLKSIDNGNSWTKTIVDPFPIPMYDFGTMASDTSGDSVGDTIDTNDGAVEVLLDNSGNAHVFYGNMRILQEAPDTTGYSYFRFEDGLRYWNESFGSSPARTIATVQDINGNDTLDIANMGTFPASLTSFPSASIDAAGNLYVTYAGVYEGKSVDDVVGTGKCFRHQYVMRSEDGGVNWCYALDVTDPTGDQLQEGVYGMLTERTDNNIHLIYMRDGSPGHGLTLNTANAQVDPQDSESSMVYSKIPTGDIACGVGISELENDIAYTLYPNPADNTVNISFKAAEGKNVAVNIYNVIGQNVNSFENRNTSANTVLTINLENYNSGIYFVTLTIGTKQYSQKLIVK